jgi:hypothetical protein
MEFIEPNLEVILQHLETINATTTPNWGEMSAQRMVEHLSDSLKMAVGKNTIPLEIPEDKIPRMKDFLHSDKPMAKNSEVAFAKKGEPLRNEDMDFAIDELAENWIEFEDYFSENEGGTTLHPYYGMLNYEEWLRLHAKHFTHHFSQFNLVSPSVS